MYFFKAKLATNRLKYTSHFIALICKNNFFTAEIFICSSLIHRCQNSMQIYKKPCINELDIHWIHLNRETNHIRMISNHIVFYNLVQTWWYKAYWWPIVCLSWCCTLCWQEPTYCCFGISSIYEVVCRWKRKWVFTSSAPTPKKASLVFSLKPISLLHFQTSTTIHSYSTHEQ